MIPGGDMTYDNRARFRGVTSVEFDWTSPAYQIPHSHSVLHPSLQENPGASSAVNYHIK